MSNLVVIQKKLDRLESKKITARREQRDIIKRSLIKCAKCNRKSQLSSWVFIQDMYYIQPFSCTGGDYWLNAKTRSCHIVCPKCSKETYLYRHSQKDKIVNLVDSYPFSKSELFQKVEQRRRE